VDDLVRSAGEKLKAGDAAGAARDVAVASNLESETAFPLFQYSGPDLHARCTTAPGECLTRAPADDAVAAALAYLLEGEKVRAFIDGLDAEEKRSLFPPVALERDPGMRDLFAALAEAHAALGEIESGRLAALRADVGRAAQVTAALAGFLAGASPAGEGTARSLERLRRTAGGLVKDFEGLDSLLDDLQLKRVKRRIGNLLESEDELRAAGEVVKPGDGGGRAALDDAVALIEEFRRNGILEAVDEIEAELAGLVVGLLGRRVHSEQHWQYLRELAFKYPVSPLVCCIRKLNDRYMVVPRWDGALTAILREFLESGPAGSR